MGKGGLLVSQGTKSLAGLFGGRAGGGVLSRKRHDCIDQRLLQVPPPAMERWSGAITNPRDNLLSEGGGKRMPARREFEQACRAAAGVSSIAARNRASSRSRDNGMVDRGWCVQSCRRINETKI